MRKLVGLVAAAAWAGTARADCEAACVGLSDCADYRAESCSVANGIWGCDCPGCRSECASRATQCAPDAPEAEDSNVDWASMLTSTYDERVTLIAGHYELFYTVDATTLRVGLVANTTGWVGFGIAGDGGMPGADMVIGWVDDVSGAAVLGDYHALDSATPLVDSCDDWTLVAAAQGDGYTSIEAMRLLDTGDAQDRAIPATWTQLPVLGACGSSDDLTYHEAVRATLTLTNVTLQGDVLELFVSNAETARDYRQCFPLPDRDGYAAAIEPVMSEHVRYVQVLAFASNDCEADINATGHVSFGAGDLLYAWSPGVPALTLPHDAGIPIGDIRSILLDVRYSSKVDTVDCSGVRLFATSEPRPYSTGVLALGDRFGSLLGQPVFQQQEVARHRFVCDCASAFLGARTVGVYTVHQHMHAAGRKVVTSVYGGHSKQLVHEIRTDFFQVDHQTSASFVPPVRISGSDSFVLDCFYEDHDGSVVFGPGSDDETCVAFLYVVWPSSSGGLSWNCAPDACEDYCDPVYGDDTLLARTFGQPCGASYAHANASFAGCATGDLEDAAPASDPNSAGNKRTGTRGASPMVVAALAGVVIWVLAGVIVTMAACFAWICARSKERFAKDDGITDDEAPCDEEFKAAPISLTI